MARIINYGKKNLPQPLIKLLQNTNLLVPSWSPVENLKYPILSNLYSIVRERINDMPNITEEIKKELPQETKEKLNRKQGTYIKYSSYFDLVKEQIENNREKEIFAFSTNSYLSPEAPESSAKLP